MTKTGLERHTQNVLVDVGKETIPANVETGKVVDKPVTGIKDFFCENNGKLYNNNKKITAHLPVSLLIPPKAKIKSGTVDQGTYDTLEENDPIYLPFWLSAVKKHDPDLQVLLNSNDTVKEFLPHLPAMGHGYLDHPFVAFTTIDEDNNANLEDNIEALKG